MVKYVRHIAHKKMLLCLVCSADILGLFLGGNHTWPHIVHLLRLLRWNSGQSVETTNAQQVSVHNDDATADALEQLRTQLHEKNKTLEELHGQFYDLEVST